METASYKIELRIDGVLIGDVSRLAQNLTWARRRTKVGVDSIDFTLNDVLFAEWCEERNTDINTMIRPLALDCRIVRNGIEVVGGFLATLPSYTPRGTSADLAMHFDGYQNLLAGVYMYPVGTQTGAMGTLVSNWIQVAETRSSAAGKAFGFTQGTINALPSVTHTFDNYISIKDAIANRCDNISGAGPFDVYWHPDRTYDVIKDSNFGHRIHDYIIDYPARLTGVSATSISAQEVSGFASVVIGIGAGEISAEAAKNTAIITTQTNSASVDKYGYGEAIYQDSSISQLQTLEYNSQSELARLSNPIWQPETTLTGRQVNPQPEGNNKIWVGDTIEINNAEDLTGMTSGWFRVNELEVTRSATGAESIRPIWERV